MKKFTSLASLGALSLVLAACGSAEDAATEASPDTVEMAADEALEPVTLEPVEDEDADLDAVEGPDAVSEEDAANAADDAASVAAQAEAAAAEAEDAVNAATSAVEAAEKAAEKAKKTID